MEFLFCLRSQVHNSLPSIQSASDLLVSLHKALKFSVQVSVLYFQQAHMLLQCCNLRLEVLVPVDHAGIAELDIIKFLPDQCDLVFSLPVLGLEVEYLRLQLPVLLQFEVSLSGNRHPILIVSVYLSG